ncbi:MAG: histidine kinase [Coriobacteriia bacterium]
MIVGRLERIRAALPSRSVFVDLTLVGATTVIGLVALASLVVEVPRYAVVAAVVGLLVVAAGTLVARFASRPDHLRAMQSEQILRIATQSLAHLRKGLDEETAGAVCRLAYLESEADAVAITDTERVLGFAGIGEDHHTIGGPILTRATREALEHNEHRILSSKEEIGCPRRDCMLAAAIVVPLEMRGRPAGTLKFYYTTPRLLNETQVTMVEGLAYLLSTQLELSELERQTELACRMELKALQAQINPHFLFNTINTIAMLIRTDPAEARHLLREFATFYRRTLEAGDEMVTLARELEYTRSYLGFERARFGDRIRVVEDVAEDTLPVLVPAFALQPVVENALQHGMPPEGSLLIRISASRRGELLTLGVADDGLGIPEERLPHVLEPGYGKGLGIALKNVDDRLRGHFGPGSGISVASVFGGGTTVTLSIVLGPATASEA